MSILTAESIHYWLKTDKIEQVYSFHAIAMKLTG